MWDGRTADRGASRLDLSSKWTRKRTGHARAIWLGEWMWTCLSGDFWTVRPEALLVRSCSLEQETSPTSPNQVVPFCISPRVRGVKNWTTIIESANVSSYSLSNMIFDTVERIGGRVRPQLFGAQPVADDAVRRILHRSRNCRDSVATIGLEHFVELLPMNEPMKHEFYAERCCVERWSVRTLCQKVRRSLYERTGLSHKPEELAEQELAALRADDTLTADLVFRDLDLLDFLGIKRHLQRAGPGVGNPARDRAVHPRTRSRVRLRRAPRADRDRRIRLLHRPALLPPQAQTARGDRLEAREVGRQQGAEGALSAVARKVRNGKRRGGRRST